MSPLPPRTGCGYRNGLTTLISLGHWVWVLGRQNMELIHVGGDSLKLPKKWVVGGLASRVGGGFDQRLELPASIPSLKN